MRSKSTSITLLTLLSLFTFAARVVYHAVPVKANPPQGAVLQKSPPSVTIWYGLELLADHSTVKVLDATGKQVDLGNGNVDLTDPDHGRMIVKLPGTLPPGIYTVNWKAVTAGDSHRGHITTGEYMFTVATTAAAQQSNQAQATTDPNYAWRFAGVDQTADPREAQNSLAGFYIVLVALVVILPLMVVGGLWLLSRRRRKQARES